MTEYRGAVYPRPRADFPELAIVLDGNNEVVFSRAVETEDEGERVLEDFKAGLEDEAKKWMDQ